MNSPAFSAPLGAATAYLEVLGAPAPAMFALREEAVIGRDPQDSLEPDKFLCIPEHTISRRHARIRRRGGIYFAEDLHSRNGTFVDGNRLRPGAWHPLRDGDELAVASTHIVFHSLVQPARDEGAARITRAVDATQWTRFAEPVLDPARKLPDSEVQKTVHKLHAMAQVSIALGAVTDRATLIEKIMNFIFDLFPLAERAFILLRQGESETLAPVAARRRDGRVENPDQIRISRTIVDEVIHHKQAILSVDTLSDRHFASHHSIVDQAIRSVMCVPLILGQEVLGLIQVDTSSDPYAFKDADLEILTGVCAEAAVALKNFQLYSDIEKLLDGFVRASVQAIEERDPVTAGHSFRVAAFAERLASAVDRADSPPLRQVQFSKEQLREIRYAALLHDFGKVGVREHVLRKEKKLHGHESRLLDLRFRYARACLERKSYRDLARLHLQRELPMAEFRAVHAQIEQELEVEVARLQRFADAIRRANEPTISVEQVLPGLAEVRDYSFADVDGDITHLLEHGEFAALGLAKGCLTDDERRQIEAHVVDSYSFLILIPWTRDLASVPAIAHGHHEKLDGSGYPMGLRGAQIGMQTRILTICDIYDALTAGDRPYKKAIPAEMALELMAAECRAGHIDAEVFRVFVEAKVWGTA